MLKYDDEVSKHVPKRENTSLKDYRDLKHDLMKLQKLIGVQK